MNIASRKQRFLYEHSETIQTINVTENYIISSAKAEVPKKKRSNDPEIEVVIWDLNQANGRAVMKFKPPLMSLTSLFLSQDE
jgi:hypothetical protein